MFLYDHGLDPRLHLLIALLIALFILQLLSI